jgi:penicillin-insensitive murein endopeptidase
LVVSDDRAAVTGDAWAPVRRERVRGSAMMTGASGALITVQPGVCRDDTGEARPGFAFCGVPCILTWMRWLALVGMLAGCAELGVISDGTSISAGKPSQGYLIEGVRLPDHGEGFLTREVWQARGNRFGTDELIDLVTAVAHRMQRHPRDVKLVVADLSGRGGGNHALFHRSHQSGRDVDLLYYMRDARGKPFEADAMHVFNAAARATDGTGITIDIPRTWTLVKELITAPEAVVQWVFMYEPIARRLIEHAAKIREPEALISRARKTLKQPGDSARHNDHLHVRVYCSAADKAYGCLDIGPMELLAERQAGPSPLGELLNALTMSAPASDPGGVADRGGTRPGPSAAAARSSAAAARSSVATAASGSSAVNAAPTAINVPQRLGRLLHLRTDRVYLHGWR